MCKTRPGILCCFLLVLCFGWFGVCCLASLSFVCLFFSEFFSLGILVCALGVPRCIFPVVFAQFLLHQILLYCLLLLGASLHLCLALQHPWLSVETLVVVCHSRNIKPFFLHNSKFPPRCFAVSTVCNWCIIFRIFLCASMFVHASMHLNQKNCDIMRPTNHPEEQLYKKGVPSWRLYKMMLSILVLCRTKMHQMLQHEVWGGSISCEGHLTLKNMFWPEVKKSLFYLYERTRCLIRRDHNGGWTTENK